MDIISGLLLFLSILLCSWRGILSKSISDAPFGEKSFFILQSLIFFSGAIVLFILNGIRFPFVSLLTLIYSLIYALLLISAQWFYTAALKSGSASVCATVYSMGFIFPTLSGMLFYEEPISSLKIFGILIAIPTIALSGFKGKDDTQGGIAFLFPLLIAMLSSGGLGIMQKLQQNSPYPHERSGFMLIAFLCAAVLSLISAFIKHRGKTKLSCKKISFACAVGAAFAACNLLNTILAGRLESAVFFPVLNIGIILVSLILSILIFKESFTRKHLLIISLSALSIISVSVSF